MTSQPPKDPPPPQLGVPVEAIILSVLGFAFLAKFIIEVTK